MAGAPWRLIFETDRPAEQQMLVDERLAQEGRPVLRLFTWRPWAMSLGWKQPRPEWLARCATRTSNIVVVERPTGGGIACHGTDVSWSVVMPRTEAPSVHHLASSVSWTVANLCESFGAPARALVDVRGSRRITVCLCEPSNYAVMTGMRKLAGLAIRRYHDSWLVQGSLLVRPLPSRVLEVLPSRVRHDWRACTVSLSEAAGRDITEEMAVQRWMTQGPAGLLNQAAAAEVVHADAL